MRRHKSGDSAREVPTPCLNPRPHPSHRYASFLTPRLLCPGVPKPSAHECCACYTLNNLPCCNVGHPQEDIKNRMRVIRRNQAGITDEEAKAAAVAWLNRYVAERIMDGKAGSDG